VVVVGLGYVGLPSAICLAKAGYLVVGADMSERVVAAIRAGTTPLADAASDEEVRALVSDGRLSATTDTAAAVRDADVVLVCVPTPVHEDHMPDLGPLESASAAIGRGLQRGTVVSYESTTFPGCTERVCIPILEHESTLQAGKDFGVAYCPERLNPGDDAHTAEVTPRVLGALDARSLDIASSVYESILHAPLHLCPDIKTAECSKVLENVQRDVNIALVNEFAAMSRHLGLDAHAVLAAARTKYNFYHAQPGPGVGGHCIPVDPYYLIEEARRAGFEPRLMALARQVNDDATEAVTDVVLSGLTGEVGAKVAVLGLSYKGGVGDLRESPALRVIERLRRHGVHMGLHDPHVEPLSFARATNGARGLTIEEATRGAHVIAILTDHPEFRGIDWPHIATLAKPNAIVVDGRGLIDARDLRALGMRVWSIGRGHAP